MTYEEFAILDEAFTWMNTKSGSVLILNRGAKDLTRRVKMYSKHMPTYNTVQFSTGKSPEAVTIRVNYCSDAPTVQIILRAYKHVTHIPLGFDIGSSSVLLGMGENPVMVASSMGKLALTTGINVVDMTRLSPSYAYRQIKYLERGYDLVMPNMDISKIPQDNLVHGYPQVISLPNFKFLASSTFGNTVNVKTIIQMTCPDSDYSFMDDPCVAVHVNLQNLLKGVDRYFYANEEGATLNDLLDASPTLGMEALYQYYRKLPDQIWTDSKINLRLFRRHVKVGLDVFDAANSVEKSQLLKEALEEDFQKTKALWETKINVAGRSGVVWITDNPASQRHTGSFTPQECTEQEWYGKYYTA